MSRDSRALHVAIVDDEPLARARLRRLLHKVAGENVSLAFEASDVESLLEKAALTRVDVVFLDIEMPGGDGFTALSRWPGVRPQIVFVTAYAEFGARAFDSRALDYLLKPVTAARLLETLNRAEDVLVAAEREGRSGKRKRQVSVLVGKRRELVDVDAIDSVIVHRNYLELHVGKRVFVIREALHKFHAALASAEFVRTHRSVIVRRGAVRSSRSLGSGSYLLALQNGQQLRTGRAFRVSVQRLLGVGIL